MGEFQGSRGGFLFPPQFCFVMSLNLAKSFQKIRKFSHIYNKITIFLVPLPPKKKKKKSVEKTHWFQVKLQSLIFASETFSIAQKY